MKVETTGLGGMRKLQPCGPKQMEGQGPQLYTRDGEKFLRFDFSMFTWRHLLDTRVKMRKGPWMWT